VGFPAKFIAGLYPRFARDAKRIGQFQALSLAPRSLYRVHCGNLRTKPVFLFGNLWPRSDVWLLTQEKGWIKACCR
jgi:hypothetical protein